MKAIFGMMLHRPFILQAVWRLFFLLPGNVQHDTLFMRSTG